MNSPTHHSASRISNSSRPTDPGGGSQAASNRGNVSAWSLSPVDSRQHRWIADEQSYPPLSRQQADRPTRPTGECPKHWRTTPPTDVRPENRRTGQLTDKRPKNRKIVQPTDECPKNRRTGQPTGECPENQRITQPTGDCLQNRSTNQEPVEPVETVRENHRCLPKLTRSSVPTGGKKDLNKEDRVGLEGTPDQFEEGLRWPGVSGSDLADIPGRCH